MNYLLEKLYIGTLVERKKEGIIYCGDILCFEYNGILQDAITGEFYPYKNADEFKYMEYGKLFIIGVYSDFPKRIKPLVLTRKGLISVAQELNKMWTNISIPDEEMSRVRK